MTDQSGDPKPMNQLNEWPRTMMRIAERSQRIVSEFLDRQPPAQSVE